MSIADGIGNERLLELFFSQSMDGFFIMMLDEPVEWDDRVEKEKVLDYVFEHQRMTKVNKAILRQFGAQHPEDLLGKTPADFFAHDLASAKERWRSFFDSGTFHNETDERRLDGTPLRIEGDYTLIHDDKGRIAGHFGIQHDITDRYLAGEEIRASRQQLRALASRLERAREEERTQIAREIHDELGQALTGLKLDIAWIRGRLPRHGPLAAQCVSMIERIDKTIESVRRIATDLRPSILDQLGLEAAVEWQSQQFIARTGIVVTVQSSCEKGHMPEVLASSAFRILQESLTNVARHACATAVDVRLVQTSSLLVLEVEDNGVGVPPDVLEKTSSLGLIGMRERALACGGKLTIASGPGMGTIVQLNVPLAQGVVA
jgi:PAS domain S-box-containing protein